MAYVEPPPMKQPTKKALLRLATKMRKKVRAHLNMMRKIKEDAKKNSSKAMYN